MEKIEEEKITFEIENGIIIGMVDFDYVDLDLARKVTNYRLKIQKGKAYPLLSKIKSVKNCTKPARDFLASEEGCTGAIAVAILIDSPIGNILGNFFINISKPLRPTKIFTNEAEAKKWLSQYVKKD